jgi:hypothetical protein
MNSSIADAVLHRCSLCNGGYRITREQARKKLECPHCYELATFLIPSPAVSHAEEAPPVLEVAQGTRELPHSVEKTELTFGGLVLTIIGWVMVVGGVLAFIFWIFGFAFAVSRSEAAVVIFILAIGTAAIGTSILDWARRLQRYWVCSECGNRLSSKESKLCTACRAAL